MSITEIFGVLFLLMLMQVLGAHIQVKRYRSAVSSLHKLGNVGIGGRRGRFGPGHVVIIACDGQGSITGVKEMRGMTIFASFKDIPELVGKNICELRNEYENLPHKQELQRRGYIQALKALEERLYPQDRIEDTADEV